MNAMGHLIFTIMEKGYLVDHSSEFEGTSEINVDCDNLKFYFGFVLQQETDLHRTNIRQQCSFL